VVERTTGIEPAFSAWERDAGCTLRWLQARFSWFVVAEGGPTGAVSYIGSYTFYAMTCLCLAAPMPLAHAPTVHRASHSGWSDMGWNEFWCTRSTLQVSVAAARRQKTDASASAWG
jgi:hypothetical protein